MKAKAILATALLAVTGVTNAAIEGPQGSNTINSDLILTIYDAASDSAYVQDLEVNYADIIGGNFADTYSLDAAALNVFSGVDTSTLTWSLFAAGQDVLNPAEFGSVTTSVTPPPSLGFVQLSATATEFNALTSVANQYPGLAPAIDGGADSDGTGSALSAAVASFQNGIGGQVPFSTAASADASLELYWIHLDEFFGEVPPTIISPIAWSLNLDDLGNATLSAVPVPAAVWLLASGLVGLGAISRRRKAA